MEITIKEMTKEDIAPTANLYAKVFADAPWNEVSKCPTTEKFTSQLSNTLCSCCGKVLQEAYPLNETEEYIKSETLRKYGKALVALVGEILVGFGWSYYDTSEQFLSEKYKGLTSPSEISFGKRIQQLLPKEFTYISEVGVSFNYRGNGIGGRIVNALIPNRGSIVLRTNSDSPMVKIAEKVGLVVLNKEYDGLPIVDPINPKRLIFNNLGNPGR